MKQLKMLRFGEGIDEYPLPDGYSCELFDGSDKAISDWLEICSFGLNSDKNISNFENAISGRDGVQPEKDLFFVCDEKGKRVATAAAIIRKEGIGGVHMVAALPECRGKGIGHFLIRRAVNMLYERGFCEMGLTTDDFRLSAIKTYLDAGFRPYLWHDDESDMKKRWDDVISVLKYKNKVEYIEETHGKQ